MEELDQLSNTDPNEFLDARIQKYDKLGYFQETE
jgi:acetyl-CoA carboxylase alpha subunit